ncbi:MAG: NfeD family protein [Candidatus Thermoplasmatota archaeon]|jgi:membrane-bound ClpP family serine protease|nr:NfeD family protein [Candidatus Thermoplasmatota archaeon]
MISQGTFDATIILVAIVFFFLGAWLYRLLLWYPRGRKPLTGSHSLIGKEGRVIADNGHVVTVSVDGVNWTAHTEFGEKIIVGDTVVVTAVSGLRITVRGIKYGH